MTPLEHALALAARGIPVFPCKANKAPLTKRGFHDASTDENCITGWWRDNPNALVGMPTGNASGLLVVDIDPEGEGWYRANLERLDCRFVQSTRRGHHLYFRHLDGARCNTGKLSPGVDVRAEGGYVIRWDAHGLESGGRDADCGPVPDWLVELLVPPSKPTVQREASTLPGVPRNQWRPPARLLEALRILDPNHYGRWLDVGMAIHHDSVGTAEGFECWDTWSRKGHDYGETKYKWSTFRADKPGGVTLGTVYAMADAARQEADVHRLLSLSTPGRKIRTHWPTDFDKIKPPRQLVENLLVSGSLALLYGASNVGKSTIGADLGMHIARGEPWAGLRVEQGLVVHVAGEGWHGVMSRLAAHCKHHNVPPTMPYAVVSGVDDLMQPRTVAELVDEIRTAEVSAGRKVTLILLDTVARLFSADENDGAAMRQLVASGDELREATGATVVLVHHAGKDVGRGARGHSSLRAAVDTEILVEGDCNPRLLTVTKQRDLSPIAPLAFELVAVEIGLDFETGATLTACIASPTGTTGSRARAGGRNQQKALTALRLWVESASEPAITLGDLRGLLSQQGINRHRFPEVLNWMTQAGLLVGTSDGYQIERGAL